MEAWRQFKGDKWRSNIDIQDFISSNYTEYLGDESFLEGPTDATVKLVKEVKRLKDLEMNNNNLLDVDTDIVMTLTSHEAGYINKDLEKIVGLQTEKPLKRGLNVYGGIRMAEGALKAHGKEISPLIHEIFTEHRKTHNQGVFDVYDEDILKARKNKIITGLPDALDKNIALSLS